VGFETTISAGERPQTYALDRAATGTGHNAPRYGKYNVIVVVVVVVVVVAVLFVVVVCVVVVVVVVVVIAVNVVHNILSHFDAEVRGQMIGVPASCCLVLRFVYGEWLSCSLLLEWKFFL